MKYPDKDELQDCFCYMIVNVGTAYWNHKTKALYQFDMDGNITENSTSEKCPGKNVNSYGNIYIRIKDGFAYGLPMAGLGIDSLGLASRTAFK
ncbi:hypothetical protein U1E44_01370 [Arenibacter sp. GZD96]|uniref:hypothetical protein n=1 Tax=Aurantibrevibacter litoralis TaxID=3106030 RepID=UPI002AFF147B|nr:hypothetical protein [Arenibacter sp. GZD-96]MEA1784728.1 hypothetical protein [Arenibacter sp. GZD-96]